ncbi:hypothetical protein ACRYCC_02540 [Actinomadura scrupuli]|uniref:hypothetical protein n=1 Tax=Actinomadura scrupuli TaxID=559629 RepID=UPI003D991EBE
MKFFQATIISGMVGGTAYVVKGHGAGYLHIGSLVCIIATALAALGGAYLGSIILRLLGGRIGAETPGTFAAGLCVIVIGAEVIGGHDGIIVAIGLFLGLFLGLATGWPSQAR